VGKGFAHEDNATDHWLTPPDLIELLGPFDLDPCAYHSQPWKTAAVQYALPETDGLMHPWQPGAFVWCNPPYGPEMPKWMQRMSLHRNGLMLIFARCETNAFTQVWDYANAVGFLKGRIKFCRPTGEPGESGTAPSAVIAFGEEAVCRLARLHRHPKYRAARIRQWDW